MNRKRPARRRFSALLAVALASIGATTSGCSTSDAAAAASKNTNPSGQGACGDKGLPDCPLQGWMKATLKAYLAANDTVRLAGAFEQLAAKAPPGFDGWQESAQEAAAAARAGDVAGVKASCKRCHDAHRSRYRNERRAVALF